MRKSTSGFTLVEVLVTMVIIAILVAISYFSFTNYQAQARDSQRMSSARIIAEGLERYYDQNNEYPTADKLIGDPALAQSTLGLKSVSVLKAPRAPVGVNNSLSDDDLINDSGNPGDIFAYVPNCNSDGGCESFKLEFRKEATGNIFTIESRRKAYDTNNDTGGGDQGNDIPTPSAPTVTATPVAGGVVGSVSADVNCDVGTPEYKIRSRVNRGDWSTWSAYGSLTDTTLSLTTAPGNRYGFQAIARCTSADGVSSDSEPSEETEYYEPGPSAPDAPTAQAGLSGSNVVGSVQAGVTCDIGTPQYKISSRTNGGDWSAWSSYGTQAATTKSIAASPATQYGFQVIARCVAGSAVSADSPPSDEAEYYQPGDASTPTVTAAAYGSYARGTSSTVSCAGTAYYQMRSQTNGGAWSAWTGWTTTRTLDVTAAQGSKYGFQAHAKCTLAGSTSSDSNIASYISPISAPAKPSMTAAMSSSNVRGTIGAVTCPSGTSAQYHIAYRYNANSLSAYPSWTTSRVRDITAYYGAQHTFRGQASCVSAYTQSAATTTSDANYVRTFVTPTASSISLRCDSPDGVHQCTWTTPKITHPGPTSGASINTGTRQCRKYENGAWHAWSSDWTVPKAGDNRDSKCYYMECSIYDYYQVRYINIYIKSPYDTSPTTTATTNSARCS